MGLILGTNREYSGYWKWKEWNIHFTSIIRKIEYLKIIPNSLYYRRFGNGLQMDHHTSVM